LKIALDATYSVGNNLSGVGVYSRELLAGLAAHHPEVEFLFCYRPHRFLRSLKERLPGNCRRKFLLHRAPGPVNLYHGLNQRLPEGPLPPSVSTFHDLFVLTGDYSTPEFRQRFAAQAKDAARRSDLIVAVSVFTAGQVAHLLGVERSRLRVIPHGTRVPSGTGNVTAREPMILHVGAIQRRKNVARLVKAFERTAPEWRLVLAGSCGFGAEEILECIAHSPRRGDIEVPGYVAQNALEDLYARAAILAFPSLDEGFGMPVLDAMARGVPVLTSDCSALKEVAGDAALLVDPADQDAISEGLDRLTKDPALRADLAERGRVRATRFPWDSAVAETWNVYRELLRNA
jgi:glycosyltransferase involved in cell wall biosynthesis